MLYCLVFFELLNANVELSCYILYTNIFVKLLQGCRSPLVVKLADSQKEKEMKRLQQMQAQLLNGAGAVGLGALGQQYLAVSICSQLVYLKTWSNLFQLIPRIKWCWEHLDGNTSLWRIYIHWKLLIGHKCTFTSHYLSTNKLLNSFQSA